MTPGCAEHDGRIVADLIAESAGYHGEPFTLHLQGPGGGTFTQRSAAQRSAGQGSTGETHSLDAIEFARILAEPADGDGVLRHKLPL